MISHQNIIANILQFNTYESVSRSQKGIETQSVPGLLPFSHIYALVVMSHACTWRGDGVIVLPRFELKTFLQTIQDHKINQLFVVSI
jgi:acyl-CoA synthetase (AMP-forming)/AMP-acid ligase II